jgi:hypothetical protein
LGAINNNGLALGSSPYNISFASVGVGLTGDDLANLNRLTYNLQTNLGRIDPDAQAFYNRVTAASGSLTATEISAINTLVGDLKSYGIWSSMKAIYPMVGASAAACAQNLKSSSFTGTFNGGVTFSNLGITGNGTSGYMNTNLNQSTEQTSNNLHISIYQRNILSSNSGVSMGLVTGSVFSRFYLNYGGSEYLSLQSSTQAVSSIETPQQGMFILSRNSSANFFKKQNNLTIETFTNASTALLNVTYALLAGNEGSTFGEFSTANLAFASIGDGLTDTQAANLYTAVQKFQTTLGRQV